MLTLTALMDDKAAHGSPCKEEHGLSVLVEFEGKRILFDCGQSGLFLENATALGLDLKGLDAVVLSHSHYDHAAGFRFLAQKGLAGAVLYTGTHFFEPKYAVKNDALRNLSAGFDRTFPEAQGIVHREIGHWEEILPGVHLISGFPRVFEFEKIPVRFVRQSGEGLVPDDFPDEVCMALEMNEGLAVLVGCAHPGILNMLTHVSKVLGKPVRAVFGGTHLLEAEDGRIRYTVNLLADMGVETLGLSHCSGSAAEEAVRREPRVRGCYLAAGDSLHLA